MRHKELQPSSYTLEPSSHYSGPTLIPSSQMGSHMSLEFEVTRSQCQPI